MDGARGLVGLCIAPCCHHRCTWEAYVGKDELMELGLTQREIELAFWMAGECSCPQLSCLAPLLLRCTCYPDSHVVYVVVVDL